MKKNQGGGVKARMSDGTLTGSLLIAMPHMQDTRFAQSLVYICGHDEMGAMGLIINKPIEGQNVADLMMQLGLENSDQGLVSKPIHLGGPIEMGRGFILHSDDYKQDGTLQIEDRLCLSATLEILISMGQHKGPRQSICALGYAGWMAGQLEGELQQNSWLVLTHPDADLLFFTPDQDKWKKAFDKLGVHPELLSFDAGHA